MRAVDVAFAVSETEADTRGIMSTGLYENGICVLQIREVI